MGPESHLNAYALRPKSDSDASSIDECVDAGRDDDKLSPKHSETAVLAGNKSDEKNATTASITAQDEEDNYDWCISKFEYDSDVDQYSAGCGEAVFPFGDVALQDDLRVNVNFEDDCPQPPESEERFVTADHDDRPCSKTPPSSAEDVDSQHHLKSYECVLRIAGISRHDANDFMRRSLPMIT